MQNNENNHKEKKPDVSFTTLAAEHAQSAAKGVGETDLTFSQLSDGPGSENDGMAGNDSHEAGDIKRLYDRALRYVNRAYDAAKSGNRFSLEEGIEISNQLASQRPEPDLLFVAALHMDNGSEYLYNHPVNTSILAVKLGASLGLEGEKLAQLGLAALLHDIGSVRVSDKILIKSSALTNTEMGSIKQRPNHSFEILQDFKDDHPYLAETAVQVYERIDGSGYPMGLQRDEIHEYAQIIGLVDVYEALTHRRPHRKRFQFFAAIKEIIRTYKNNFQRRYLKAFLNNFSVFPLFSYVRLNSGAIGRVIETYPDQPFRPKIKVIYDSQARKLLTDRMISLPDNPLLHITDSVEEDEINGISGY
jgi:HD-GYP domain-containing protein (c-di-GMP phosphodiesterase class II)